MEGHFEVGSGDKSKSEHPGDKSKSEDLDTEDEGDMTQGSPEFSTGCEEFSKGCDNMTVLEAIELCSWDNIVANRIASLALYKDKREKKKRKNQENFKKIELNNDSCI